MEPDETHYKKLIDEYKSKHFPDIETDVEEEQTEVNTASVFTDPFTDSLPTEDKEKDQLLANLIAELNKFAQEEVDDSSSFLEEKLDALEIAKTVEAKRKEKLTGQSTKGDEVTEILESKQEADQVDIYEEECAEEEIIPEEDIEVEPAGYDNLEDLEELEKMEESRRLRASKEFLMKRAFIYQVLDSLIPEYEEELSHYLREGETMLLAEDLPVILQSFGANPTEAQSQDIVDSVKKEGGRISFLDFLVILAEQMKNIHTTEEVIDAFRMLDLNNGGDIPVPILKEVLTTIGERLTDAEMDEMINEADPHQEGFIKYEAFVRRLDRNQYVAIPAKRRALIKLLRKEDKRKRAHGKDEESESLQQEEQTESEEETDPLFGTPINK